MNNRISMRTLRTLTLGTVGAAMLLAGLGGCAGMSGQDKNTAIGAGVGAAGGAILTGGSVLGTVGGIIGHEIKKMMAFMRCGRTTRPGYLGCAQL